MVRNFPQAGEYRTFLRLVLSRKWWELRIQALYHLTESLFVIRVKAAVERYTIFYWKKTRTLSPSSAAIFPKGWTLLLNCMRHMPGTIVDPSRCLQAYWDAWDHCTRRSGANHGMSISSILLSTPTKFLQFSILGGVCVVSCRQSIKIHCLNFPTILLGINLNFTC